MTVPVQTPFTASIANGVTTSFPYAFKITDAADLEVSVDGVVITTGFTVTGVGDELGGSVDFTVAPTNGAKVLRALSPILKRETDYQQFGDWNSDEVDNDFDRIWLALQAISQNNARALKLPKDTATDQVVADDAASRVGKLVSFDASGNMTLAVPADLSLTTVSAFMATVLDDVDAAAARATLGIGTSDLLLSAGKVIVFEGATDDAFETTLTVADPTADRTITLPNASGTVALTSDITSGAQIQPISASVGSNALTISASALSLDFRSATLTSGAVTTVSGTPSNLVISSGSTLGTVSAKQSRIAVLALNNAGTIELAAVNISGGNDLTETGVISTTAEGGAGAADTANVIYSTTARSNVAYRVIGYIESTQATAGTWATAPSTIQGAGGNAVTAMSSLGYGQTWQDVTGSRAAATTYYNTTGRPILVSVTNTAAAGNSTALTVNGVVVANAYISAAASSQISAVSIVPPGSSYSVAITGTIGVWAELR